MKSELQISIKKPMFTKVNQTIHNQISLHMNLNIQNYAEMIHNQHLTNHKK